MNKEDKLALLAGMLQIRIFEEKILQMIERKELEIGFHLLMGHEAIVVGAISSLKKDDYITSNHRTLGRYLARGGDTRKIMAEIFGKESGLCHGKAGEMLIADKSTGLLFSSVTVAAGIPVAVGAALALQRISKTDRIVACFFGDGATCNGVFHEALNLAAVRKAPVLFVCENNGLSINIPQREWLSTNTVAERAAGYGMPGVRVDGTDVEAVREITLEAAERARRGQGPTLIDATTVRLRPHKEGLADNRSPDEIAKEWEKDPVGLYEKKLLREHLISETRIDEMKRSLQKEIDDAVEFAKKSEFPEISELNDNLYSPRMSAAFSRASSN